jgi:hypothetical protein
MFAQWTRSYFVQVVGLADLVRGHTACSKSLMRVVRASQTDQNRLVAVILARQNLPFLHQLAQLLADKEAGLLVCPRGSNRGPNLTC